MLELARAQGIRLPADTPDGLAQALFVKHARSLEEYLTKYEITLSVMQTAAALERIAHEFVLDAAADGLRYVEVRYSPLLHRPALTLAQAIEAPLAGIKRGEAETGVKVGLIVCAIRTRPPARGGSRPARGGDRAQDPPRDVPDVEPPYAHRGVARGASVQAVPGAGSGRDAEHRRAARGRDLADRRVFPRPEPGPEPGGP